MPLKFAPLAIIPITNSDWTPETIKNLKTCFPAACAENYLEMWKDREDYANAAPSNGPLRQIPVDPYEPYQPFDVRPGLNLIGTPIQFAVDGGKPVRQDLTANSAGGDNRIETWKAPGTGSPSMTINIMGGAEFANFMLEYGGWFANGIPAFAWGSADHLWIPNFSAVSAFIRQVPLCYQNPAFGAFPYSWPREIIPYITDDGKIGIVHINTVKALGKFGAPVTQPATLNFINSDETTYKVAAGQVAAVEAGATTIAEAGKVINASARRR